MRRISATTVAVLVLVGTVAAVPAAGLVQSSNDAGGSASAAAAQSANESNASVSPGERLSGVVGVGEAELEGEVESRAFGLAVARADSDEARAELIAEKVNETRERVQNLSEERERLREARDNGSISQGQYAARIAELAARSQNAERAATETANASEGIPADLLESRGVNASAIQELQQNAKNLTGQEVAELARSIAGERPERPEQADRGGDRDGNQSDARDGSDRGDRNDSTPTGEQADGDQSTSDGTTTDDGSTTTEEETATDEDADSDSDRGGSAGGDRGGR